MGPTLLKVLLGQGARRNWPKSKVWVKHCAYCRALFVARHGGQTLCRDDSCISQRQSAWASKSIMKRYNTDPAFRDKVIAVSQARRANSNEHISLGYLGDRDGWQCQLCHLPVTDRAQASIDHIIPLSLGGTHELANVHLAHRSCNARKNNRPANEQLLVFG